MRRFVVTFALILLPAVASAQQNVTVRDILELTKAGLGEEALLALIEVNRPIFPVDVDTLKALKAGGVPPNVITAMIRSGRSMPAGPVQQPGVIPLETYAEPGAVALAPTQQVTPMPQAAPPPQVVVIEHREEPVVREVPVAYPVFVAVPVRRSHGSVDHPSHPPVKKVEPVFWGWNGKLRPDAWKPAIEIQKDAKVPLVPQRK